MSDPFASDAPLEQRLVFHPDGTILAFSGKVEYGQGIRTCFTQIVAEELDVPPQRVHVVLGDTLQTPYDFGTFGSMSTASDGRALQAAAAWARQQLVGRASGRFHVPAERLRTRDGAVHAPDGRFLTYAELVADEPLTGPVPDNVPTKAPEKRSVIGSSLRRLEGLDIVTGRAQYPGDLHLPDMLHAVVLHPPIQGSRLKSHDDGAARAVPGVEAIVADEGRIAVLAPNRGPAMQAAALLQVEWEPPAPTEERAFNLTLRRDDGVDEALAAAARRHEASFAVPHISNAPIGPSAALADVRADRAVVYTGTQRPFALKDEVAEITGLAPEQVRVLPQITSGTYGRNSIGDAAREAAWLSKAVGRPVMVEWSRADELAVSPCRPWLRATVRAGLDGDGSIVAWRYEQRTNPHTYGGIVPDEVAGRTSGRNSIPPYRIPAVEVELHVQDAGIRTAAFRSLAAAPNTFAVESFMDELAHLAGADPLEFRLRHTDDQRLRRVLEHVAERSRWGRRGDRKGHGMGLACTIYHATYVAEVVEVSVSPGGVVRLEKAWCAIDPGAVVNPDGVRNQTEGGIQQAASWTLLEELVVRERQVATTSWDTYPIARASDAPEVINVELVGDAGTPFSGVGEPGSVPVAAAIANAVFAACGARVRELPLRPARVLAAMP